MSFEDDYERSVVSALIAQFLLLVLRPSAMRTCMCRSLCLSIAHHILVGKKRRHTSWEISLYFVVDDTVNRQYANGHLDIVSIVMEQTAHSILRRFDI